MTSVALHPRHEMAPHALRSLAMALAISLNLVALLIALRPLPLPSIPQVLTPTILHATVLQHFKPVPVLPTPDLTLVKHVVRTKPVRITPRPITTAPVITPPTQVVTTETSNVAKPIEIPAGSGAASGNNDATIAYETATPPDYPIYALREGVEGTVLLRVLVDEQGKPIQVLILKSSGSHALDVAARDHVLAAWRFHAAQRDGHAVQAWAQVPVKFSLSNR